MDAQLTPGLLLRAYASGIFPMAESADDPEVHWLDPSRRGIIPLDGFHISRSLARRIRNCGFDIRFNTAFAEVVAACANRPETWINSTISELYQSLFNKGHAHSQEIWDGPELVGGVYGVTLGKAFFGESMFSTRADGSKIALAYLVDRLRQCGFALFDTQFLTDHLATLGAIEIPREAYLSRLEIATEARADIRKLPLDQSPSAILQRNGQTS